MKIKGLCETAENSDDLSDTATATITVSENIQQAVVGNIVNTPVLPGQSSPALTHQQHTHHQHPHQHPHQHQQLTGGTTVLTHAVSPSIVQQITTSGAQLGIQQQQQLGRKARIRKRSKSPDLQQLQHQHHQQGVTSGSAGSQIPGQHSQAIIIQNQNQASIVSLHQSATGNYISAAVSGSSGGNVGGGGGGGGGGVAVQQTTGGTGVTTDDSDSDKPTLQKICKTEAASISPAASTSSASVSNNAAGVTAVASTGPAIVTQIVVARDVKDKNMTSLGMGMVRLFSIIDR